LRRPRLIKLRPGSYLAIPLKDGTWAVGLAAYIEKNYSLPLGYFFNKRFQNEPPLEDVVSFTEKDAILKENFGLADDTDWRLIGVDLDFDVKRWPFPAFAYVDPITGKTYKRVLEPEYFHQLYEVPCRPEELDGLPLDGSVGTAIIESTLHRLLPSIGEVSEKPSPVAVSPEEWELREENPEGQIVRLQLGLCCNGTNQLQMRDKLEETLDKRLRKLKLGHCDGTENSATSTDLIFFVSDVGRAAKIMLEVLQNEGVKESTTLVHESPDGQKTLHAAKVKDGHHDNYH
jgi:hypothetical protein